MKWEYYVVSISDQYGNIDNDILYFSGREGWELVTILLPRTNAGNHYISGIFKRPLP